MQVQSVNKEPLSAVNTRNEKKGKRFFGQDKKCVAMRRDSSDSLMNRARRDKAASTRMEQPVFLQLLMLVVVVWAAAVILRRPGWPAVMGELVMGVIPGNEKSTAGETATV